MLGCIYTGREMLPGVVACGVSMTVSMGVRPKNLHCQEVKDNWSFHDNISAQQASAILN